jgi:HAD superfamily hydrolase (TIGR01548 family)
MTPFSPAAGVKDTPAYAPARAMAPCDINLAGTEAAGVQPALIEALTDVALARGARYPDTRPLAALLAPLLGVAPECVLVTAGADEALDRACRTMLAAGRNAIVTDPTFEMIPRYVTLAGAELRSAHWPSGTLPVDRIVALADDRTSLVAVASPNNPTGAVATIDAIRRVHDAIPGALLLLDLAYIEFADDDITSEVLALPRAVVTRTLSKAWGMPGIRVGYAVGAAETIVWMRRAGGPYPVSVASLAIAERALSSGGGWRDATVAAVRRNRARLEALLTELGAAPLASQANFVTVAGGRANWIADALTGFGVATRLLAGSDGERVRITVPTDDAVFDRLEGALRVALGPEAILFDLDGVLADVSQSYRKAIIETAAHFGVAVSAESIRARKAAGGANDDWALTTELVAAAGDVATLPEVTDRFERLYQGDGDVPGLKEAERLVTSRAWLATLAGRFPLAIVTGRPRADAEEFLARFGIRDLFAAVITRDDGPIKPDPFPVAAACRALGATRAWMIGDTPDDVVSARAAGVLPIGVVAPGDSADPVRDVLTRSGAARVLNNTTELTSCLS